MSHRLIVQQMWYLLRLVFRNTSQPKVVDLPPLKAIKPFCHSLNSSTETLPSKTSFLTQFFLKELF